MGDCLPTDPSCVDCLLCIHSQTLDTILRKWTGSCICIGPIGLKKMCFQCLPNPGYVEVTPWEWTTGTLSFGDGLSSTTNKVANSEEIDMDENKKHTGRLKYWRHRVIIRCEVLVLQELLNLSYITATWYKVLRMWIDSLIVGVPAGILAQFRWGSDPVIRA